MLKLVAVCFPVPTPLLALPLRWCMPALEAVLLVFCGPYSSSEISERCLSRNILRTLRSSAGPSQAFRGQVAELQVQLCSWDPDL